MRRLSCGVMRWRGFGCGGLHLWRLGGPNSSWLESVSDSEMCLSMLSLSMSLTN